VFKRGAIGSLNLYSWYNNVRNGDVGALRTVTVQLQNEDHSVEGEPPGEPHFDLGSARREPRPPSGKALRKETAIDPPHGHHST
jgi:hypothetical protein